MCLIDSCVEAALGFCQKRWTVRVIVSLLIWNGSWLQWDRSHLMGSVLFPWPWLFAFHLFSYSSCERKWKAAIFIQCLYEPDTVDWSNAAHIDTPVVSPMGPRRHNGEALCSSFQCPRALGCQFCYLLTQQCLWYFCEPIFWRFGSL